MVFGHAAPVGAPASGLPAADAVAQFPRRKSRGSVNASVAASEVIIPVDMTDEGALQGAVEVRGIVRRLAKRSELRVAALVRTKVDRRRIVYQRMNESLPSLAMPIAISEIPLTADFQTAAAERQTLFAWRQDSLGALAYRRLALELVVPGRTNGPRRSAPVWA